VLWFGVLRHGAGVLGDGPVVDFIPGP